MEKTDNTSNIETISVSFEKFDALSKVVEMHTWNHHNDYIEENIIKFIGKRRRDCIEINFPEVFKPKFHGNIIEYLEQHFHDPHVLKTYKIRVPVTYIVKLMDAFMKLGDTEIHQEANTSCWLTHRYSSYQISQKFVRAYFATYPEQQKKLCVNCSCIIRENSLKTPKI